MLIGDVISNLVAAKLENEELSFMYHQKEFGPRHGPRPLPSHYTTAGGGLYSLRPDLTRSGGQVIAGRAALFAAPVVVSYVGARIVTNQYAKVVDRAPEHEQSSLWRGFAQGLTGGVGIGNAGLL